MAEPVDSALTCPVCEYNLTGLSEQRCPECGTPFDPAELLSIAARQPRPILPGVSLTPARYAFRIWWLSLTSPRRLARGFPARHDAGDAVWYSLACYALGVTVFAVLTAALSAVTADSDALRLIPPVAIGSTITFWLCETVTAAILAALLKPTRAPDRYHFWRGLTHYTSGFTVLSGLWGSVLLHSSFSGSRYATAPTTWLIALAVLLWWMIALDAMVAERSASGPRQWLACFLILAIGFAALFAGFWISVLCGLACFAGRWGG